MDNPSAAAACDVAVLTVPFSGAAALLKQLKSVWKPGTIVIDTTVPLAATVGGAATRVLGVWQGSAAEQTQELLPAGISLAAAFQNLGAETLSGDEPVDCDVLVCSDDEKAKQVASELVGKIPGARALNGGKLENARIVESLTALLIGLNMRDTFYRASLEVTPLVRRAFASQIAMGHWRPGQQTRIATGEEKRCGSIHPKTPSAVWPA